MHILSMLKIKTKIKPAIPEKQLFEVDGQEFETKEAAEAYAAELKIKIEARKKAFKLTETL